MNIIQNNLANDLIRKKILNDDVFFVGRMGLTELQLMYNYVKTIDTSDYLKKLLVNNAGVYGNCIDEFLKIYFDSIVSPDFHVYWEIDSLKIYQKELFENHLGKHTLIENRSIEPFYFENPWSESLETKKVLVIHPFAQTIVSQYNNRKFIFENKKVLPNFDLITYKSVQSIGGNGPHKNWVDSLMTMQNDIDKIDFDIALLGCGAYGMPLGSFIKTKKKKTAIYIGGGLQILFGIKGTRWDSHEVVSNLYNSYWTRPSDLEKPNNHMSVENGCYW